MSTNTLDWSVPGKAVATILFPKDSINHTVVMTLQPGNQQHEARRGVIGDNSTNDDLIDIENFDHALKKIGKKKNRYIHVSLLHDQEQFDLNIVFSFLNTDPTKTGKVFKIKTNASGQTNIDILAKL